MGTLAAGRSVALRSAALRSVGLRSVGLRSVAPRSVAPRSVAPRCVAPRSVAPRSVALRSVALRSVALRSLALLLFAGLSLAAIPPAATGQPQDRQGGAGGRELGAAVALSPLARGPVSAAAQPKKAELGAAVAPLRLVPTGPTPLSVHGLHRYFGSIEIGSAGDGLTVSNRLPLERYLLGLAEVPLSWPDEALKAQAVAARTYALFTLAQPPGGSAATYGFDICASVECQVYSGADVAAGPAGFRWRSAVDSTAGQAVLYQGRPILARYHSTSGGVTLDNPQAFPDEGAYPYLQGVSSTTEQGSSLYRWTTEFTLVNMQRLAERAGFWSDRDGRLLEVASRPSSAGFHYPDLVFRSRRGTVVRTAEEVRDALRELAPQMFPSLYPGPSATGRLPEVFPSNRIDVFTVRNAGRTRGARVRVIGRGWGHGVGMSQWGAHGLALRGASYVDILTHYYTGVEVGRVPDPGALEVGLDWAESSVTVSGEFSIIDGRGKTLVKDALGTWDFDYAGTGAVSIDPPQGYGLPLRVGLIQAPERVEVGAPAYLTVALSRPAQVRTLTAASTGYDDPGARVAAAGRRRIVWLAPLEPGVFDIRVEATAGGARSRTEPVRIRVAEAPPSEGAGGEEVGASAEGDRRTAAPARFPFLVLGAVGAAIVLGGYLSSRAARRRLER